MSASNLSIIALETDFNSNNGLWLYMLFARYSMYWKTAFLGRRESSYRLCWQQNFPQCWVIGLNSILSQSDKFCGHDFHDLARPIFSKLKNTLLLVSLPLSLPPTPLKPFPKQLIKPHYNTSPTISAHTRGSTPPTSTLPLPKETPSASTF